MSEETKKIVHASTDRTVAQDKFKKAIKTGRELSRGHRERGSRNRQEEPKQFEEITIAVNRVARVVKGGRRFRFQALVVVGNRKNKVGVGVSKGQDVQAAVSKATEVAKKNMVEVALVNGTIPHDAEVKTTGARVLLKPAAPGTGIIAGGVVRQVLSTIAVTDLLSKSLGSSNKINVAYATIKALESLKPKS
jgi:small subunit ribosomal protein S5